ncbi:MAG: maleylpyruvate isomerase family mycothiol-dependent enzyme [Pleurocapsa minor GSE-CHR-MK-17-07R]|jgi:uncharacterized protein (TIGR03083 family)|nr:maleylpyruvate isomerase family mycothiol-dependent enzyme [Pleurocapsa minor GSE-CHR-MK 17-07R]
MARVQLAAAEVMTPFEDGARIPALTHREAQSMAAEELRRFQALIESLAAEDWERETSCTLWTVKDIVAHQAGHVAGFTSLGAFLRQLSPAVLSPYLRKGMSMLDAWNQGQVDARRGHSPAELIAELRGAAEASLRGRDRIPGVVRGPVLPMPGLDQPRSMGYVFDLIYTRDMWMHRMDICDAAGRSMPMDGGHDRRTVALIVRDLAHKARRGLNGRAAVLVLTGPAGGSYHVGAEADPSATLTLDIPTFCLLTSGRIQAARVLSGGRVGLSGDNDFARSLVAYCENRVLY